MPNPHSRRLSLRIRSLIKTLSLALLAGAAAWSGHSQKQSDEFDLNSDIPPAFDMKTKELVAQKNARLRYGEWLLAADLIRFDQATKRALAEGHVVFTRGDIRLIADRLEYRPEENFAKVENFRIGNGRAYVDGSSLEGNPDNFKFTDVNFYPGEPGTYLFKGKADELSLVDRNEIKGKGLSFKLGVIPFLVIPNITHPIDSETNLFEAEIDYSGHIGGLIGGEFMVPVTNDFRAGVRAALTTKRGILLGPVADYGWSDEKGTVAGSFTSGYVDDDSSEVGLDILGRPIDDGRYYAEWQHRQTFGERASISAYARYWSDSEVTRDFHEDSFNSMQEPDSYFEYDYRGDNWQATLFARSTPNDFLNVTERLPELRLTLFPTKIATGLYQGGHVSLAKLKQSQDQIFSELNESDRIDAYYGLRYSKPLAKGVQLTAKAGARAIHYSDTAEIVTVPGQQTFNFDPNDLTFAPVFKMGSGTRAYGDLGLDLKFTAHRDSEYQNEVWNIDGLRHIVEPVLSYRYQPELESGDGLIPNQDRTAFGNYLLPFDLEDRRDTDRIGEEHKLRLELRNRLQTRDKETGTRDLARLDFAVEHYLDQDLHPDDLSEIHTDFELTPARWLSARMFSRYDTGQSFVREVNTRLTIRDQGYWSVGIGNHFVRGAQLEQYFLFGDYHLNDKFKLYAVAKYDAVSNSFYEQRIGLMQRALERYGLKYELRIYDGPRRESDFSIRIGIDLFDE